MAQQIPMKLEIEEAITETEASPSNEFDFEICQAGQASSKLHPPAGITQENKGFILDYRYLI